MPGAGFIRTRVGTVIPVSPGAGNNDHSSSETLKPCPWLLWLGPFHSSKWEVSPSPSLSHHPLLGTITLTWAQSFFSFLDYVLYSLLCLHFWTTCLLAFLGCGARSGRGTYTETHMKSASCLLSSKTTNL